MKAATAIVSLAVLAFASCSSIEDGPFQIVRPTSSDVECLLQVPVDDGVLHGFLAEKRPPYSKDETIRILCGIGGPHDTLGWYLTMNGCFISASDGVSAVKDTPKPQTERTTDCTLDTRFKVSRLTDLEKPGEGFVWKVEPL